MEKLLKEKNSTLKNVELVVAGAAATKLLEVGCIPLVVGVVVFIATLVWIVKSIKSGKGNLTRKAKVLMVALAAISTMALFYGIYHKMYCHNNSAVEAQNDVVTETTPDTEEPVVEEPTEEVEEPTKVEASNTNTGKSTVVRGTCPAEDRIQVTYGNIGDTDSKAPNTTSSNTKVLDPTKETLKVKGEDKSEESDGIISETGKTTPKKEAEEKDSEEPKTDMDKENAEEVKSEESKTEESKEEKSEESRAEEKKPQEVSDDELDNMLKETETINTLPEIGLVEIDAEVYPKADTDSDEVEEPADEVVEEVKEKAIEVEAIDGYVATVNSTVQFKISGTNVKVDGLDGIDYTFSNGYLNINTGDESTVLTIEVSNSVSSVTFDVIVNGIVK